MDEKAKEIRTLLVAQMKRAIELLETESLSGYSHEFAELTNKMHEIRRDSVRFVKAARPWRK
ncbi:hypothetical protein QNH23_06275 [Siminovitchia fortis]|uniref:Uncharacterized protein n=1 Tax=Siminovitchia fortis TaxID=254758 RepID=A0A443IMN8_9BACI|nr:hypothetical protein [Siminovitchia fortis]RWR06713.1 hypothetical protein D4N35_013685 [Siminovitchia fortis]WHY82977.1 hypothetical protein QNH23_06275 [Siminovitchia fortis]